MSCDAASLAPEGGFSPEAVDTSNFGEDMLQMALKMASELEEPAVDLEAALTPSTISAPPAAVVEHNEGACRKIFFQYFCLRVGIRQS